MKASRLVLSVYTSVGNDIDDLCYFLDTCTYMLHTYLVFNYI